MRYARATVKRRITNRNGAMINAGDVVTIAPSFAGKAPPFFNVVLPEHGHAIYVADVPRECFDLLPGEVWPESGVYCPSCAARGRESLGVGCSAQTTNTFMCGGFVCSAPHCGHHWPKRCIAEKPVEMTPEEWAVEIGGGGEKSGA